MGGATGAPDAAPANDLVAIRLQCRVPWLLPLPDQAVVREQARLVLPAHGPWLPDRGPALMQRSVMLKLGVLFVQAPVAGAQRLACLPHIQVFALPLLEVMMHIDAARSS